MNLLGLPAVSGGPEMSSIFGNRTSYECRGIAFENEAMGIDFAWSIQNILREIGTDWQMIKCLAENSEFAATANAALDHFSGLTSCEGKSIAEIIEEEILASCGSGGGGEAAANELVEMLEGEDWIYLDWIEEESESRLRCLVESYMNSDSGFFCSATAPRFNGDSDFDLRFIQQNLVTLLGRTGDFTSESDPYILIRIDSDYAQNGCDVQIMKTIIHESIHAELIAFGHENEMDLLNLGQHLEFYSDNNDYDHNAFADLYRQRIVEALKELFGNTYSDDQYDALAWSGLESTQDYNIEAWDELSSSQKQVIHNLQDGIDQNCENTFCL